MEKKRERKSHFTLRRSRVVATPFRHNTLRRNTEIRQHASSSYSRYSAKRESNVTPRVLAISTQEIATALQNIMDKDASFNIVRIIVRVMVDAINLPALVSVKISTRQMKRVVVNLWILDLFRRRAWIKRSIHRLMTQAQDCGHFMLLASSERAWATRLMWRLIPRQTSLLIYKAMCA